MTAIQVLAELRRLGVLLWVDEGRLRYSAPKGVMSEAVMARLREHRTEIVEVLGGAGRGGVRQQIQPVDRGAGPLPLSFAQERMWFLNELDRDLERDNNPYVETAAYEIFGPLDLVVLERAVNEIVRRHEVLRTTFPTLDGKPHQRIRPGLFVPLPLEHCAGQKSGTRVERVRAVVAQEKRRPLDLATGPLLWMRLLRFGTTEHVLVLTMHHIVGDAWSREVFTRELVLLYEAFAEGKPSPLPDLSVQYADFASWQRKHLTGDVLDRQLEYWKQTLFGAAVLEFPRDHPQGATPVHTSAEVFFRIDENLTARVRELSRREGVTVFTTLLTAFTVLLHRYTGQHDIVVGTEVANRNTPDVEPLIGMFVNQIVLRTQLPANPTFRDVLRLVWQETTEAQLNQDLPFEKLVEELRPERNLGHQPLFQVNFSLDNVRGDLPTIVDLRIRRMNLEYEVVFDLSLFLTEGSDVIDGPLVYNSALFAQDRMTRLLDQFRAVLEEVTAQPDGHLSSLRVLPAGELTQVLDEWNDTGAADEADEPVHVLFEHRADLVPDRTAVVFNGTHVSYRCLDELANHLAHRLRTQGVVSESLVGILLKPSIERVISALAIVKAGGSIVFVDPTYPADRIDLMLSSANLSALLTTEDLRGLVPRSVDDVIVLDADGGGAAERRIDRPDVPVWTDQVLYAIYTSGSTGVPKRIGVTHRMFRNMMVWQEDERGLRGESRTLQFSTFGFCVSFQEIFTTLAEGGTLVMAPSEVRTNAEQLITLLHRESVQRLFLPFGALKLFAQVAVHNDDFPTGLKAIATAGEPLQITEHLRDLFDRLPDCPLHNQYGASETHIVTAHTLAGAAASWPANAPIGRPNRNNKVYLLDRYLRPVPIGATGELYVGGAAVPRGYLDEPVMTAGKMVADPFVPGARMYRTGDLARWGSDGTIKHLGRRDHQIKVQGFRVELGEIASVLRRHPLVRDVAVNPVDDGAGDRRIVAYIVPAEEHDATVDLLWAHCRKHLPRHAVPSGYVLLGELPLNANGKLDFPALPEPGPARRFSEREYLAPRNELEQEIADVWTEVLGVARIGVHDNFFDLGGHSMAATQVVFRVSERFRVDVPLRAMFDEPTVESLARRVVQEQAVSFDQDEVARELAALEGSQ
ncbi:amino acid adenylation domain-containing protein [Lentzea sp. NPDC034063]|uniref:non-ribosomal peptide synthetase n=1 Tax=unclassified Lentzea TaxID=2643253 RepID=UPI0033F6C756